MVLFAVLRLGFLENVMSRPIMEGFMTAVAVTVISGQLGPMLGVPPVVHPGEHHHGGSDMVWDRLKNSLGRIGESNRASIGLSAAALTIMFGLRWVTRRSWAPRWVTHVPGILVAIVLTTTVTYFGSLHEGMGVRILGRVPGGFEPPRAPRALTWSMFQGSIGPAVMIALVGWIESVTVARQMASLGEYTISSNSELLALGVSNFFGSFFGAMPVAGSVGRTQLAWNAGARTQLSGLLAGLVSIAILFATPIVHYLPSPTIASVLVLCVSGLLEVHAIPTMVRLRMWGDLALFATTFTLAIALGVEQGLILASAVSCVVLIKNGTVPAPVFVGRAGSTYKPLTRLGDARPVPGICIIQPGTARLYFLNALHLKKVLMRVSDGRAPSGGPMPPWLATPHPCLQVQAPGGHHGGGHSSGHGGGNGGSGRGNGGGNDGGTAHARAAPLPVAPLQAPPLGIVLDMTALASADFTAVEALRDAASTLSKTGVMFGIAGVRSSLRVRLARHAGLIAAVDRRFMASRVSSCVSAMEAAVAEAAATAARAEEASSSAQSSSSSSSSTLSSRRPPQSSRNDKNRAARPPRSTTAARNPNSVSGAPSGARSSLFASLRSGGTSSDEARLLRSSGVNLSRRQRADAPSIANDEDLLRSVVAGRIITQRAAAAAYASAEHDNGGAQQQQQQQQYHHHHSQDNAHHQHHHSVSSGGGGHGDGYFGAGAGGAGGSARGHGALFATHSVRGGILFDDVDVMGTVLIADEVRPGDYDDGSDDGEIDRDVIDNYGPARGGPVQMRPLRESRSDSAGGGSSSDDSSENEIVARLMAAAPGDDQV
jgi:MFS superfamily sulfate permease-like transporter